MSGAITVNGNEYAWGNVNIVLPGRIVAVDGVIDISYGEKQDKKAIYGRGFKPKAIQAGSKSFAGSVKIYQSEFEGMVAGLSGSSPNDIRNAVLTISYGGAETDNIIITDRCVGVNFSEWKKGMKTGDLAMEIDLPFEALDIELQV